MVRRIAVIRWHIGIGRHCLKCRGNSIVGLLSWEVLPLLPCRVLLWCGLRLCNFGRGGTILRGGKIGQWAIRTLIGRCHVSTRILLRLMIASWHTTSRRRCAYWNGKTTDGVRWMAL